MDAALRSSVGFVAAFQPTVSMTLIWHGFEISCFYTVGQAKQQQEGT
jgi:hypothetical protein